MSTMITRRNVLKFIGGSAAGLLFTPLPWKLLDDTSIWTQNGPWIPKVPRGPISYRYTACALCPAGCSIKARLVAQQPVSLTGVADHPVSYGMVCPVGLAAHHLAYHPERIREAQRVSGKGNAAKFTPVTLEEIISRASSAASDGTVAILDGRPGSVMSRMYRTLAGSIRNSQYVAPSYYDGRFMATLGTMFGQQAQFGLHLEKAATILSFGVPLLDGWSGSAEVVKAFASRRSQLNIILVDSTESSTALCADKWLSVKPGTEAVLAAAIVHVLICEKLYDSASAGTIKHIQKVVSEYGPENASSITGVPAESIVETARRFAAERPSIAIANDFMDEEEQKIIWALNLLVGAAGKNGCVSQRVNLPAFNTGNKLAPVTAIGAIPDESIRLLIIDSSVTESAIPWTAVERKLRPGESTVIFFSPYKTDLARYADFVIPTPAPYESIEEIAANPYSPAMTFSVSAPLMQAQGKMVEPMQFLQRVTAGSLSAPTIAEALRSQADAIFKSRRGTVYSPSDTTTRNITEYFSADDFWTALTEGGCWKDNLPERAPTATPTFKGNYVHSGVERIAPGFDARFAAVSPILSKLTRESHLKRAERV